MYMYFQLNEVKIKKIKNEKYIYFELDNVNKKKGVCKKHACIFSLIKFKKKKNLNVFSAE